MQQPMLEAEDRIVGRNAVMEALRNGNYYATQGPEFYKIDFADGKLTAAFSPAVSVVAITNRYFGKFGTLPPAHGKTPGGPINEITLDFSDFVRNCRNNEKSGYIRLQIIDSNGRYAWTNPITIK